ncbi:hypothetical protein QE152_g15576 [Popillia japonica]|uniref:Uncharacterized protein n=1 Tax=Popillia japonica TaxID=7064 RepID=A0AAW1L6N1_POPJA
MERTLAEDQIIFDDDAGEEEGSHVEEQQLSDSDTECISRLYETITHHHCQDNICNKNVDIDNSSKVSDGIEILTIPILLKGLDFCCVAYDFI